MSNLTYVPLRNDLLVRLIARDGQHYDGIIEHAVEDYLDRTENDYFASRKNSGEGHTWGQVKLPEGTLLRTRYKGEWLIASVSNGAIQFGDERFGSPSKACNAMRGNTSNNAWITFEVKRPQDIDFGPADRFRR